jgi:squalene synthase HpnC
VVDLDAAYAHCTRLARAHYENFPVASWLLPRDARPHVAAVYAFARGADDIADEGDAPAGERLEGLARWRSWLHLAAAGSPVAAAGAHEPVFVALAASIRARGLPVALLDDLLSAFAQDVTVTRYATWAGLLDYCRRSANPVGRLVLRICGHDRADLDRASDNVCTALQLTNFWQDLGRDWAKGRLYLPEDVWRRAGAHLDDFDPGAPSPAWRGALGVAIERTRALFEGGRGVCDGVEGRLRYELRLTWLGGTRILQRTTSALAGRRFDRPSLGPGDAVPIAWRLLTWPASRHARVRPA